jgi:polar amino acid transport system substrate-binding protein
MFAIAELDWQVYQAAYIRGSSWEGEALPASWKQAMTLLRVSVCILFLCADAAHVWAQELKFVTMDFPPFSYELAGQAAGPFGDIVRRTCAEMKMKCTIQVFPWSRAQEEVKDGRANGMFPIGWNQERARWVHFTPAIVTTEYGFFVKSDNPLKFSNLSDIAGYTIGVFGPSNTSTSLGALRDEMKRDGLNAITIDLRPDSESGFKKLAVGRVDAVFTNRDVGNALIAQLGIKDDVRYSGAQEELRYYIGFSTEHNDEKILRAFDAALLTLYHHGDIKTMLDKYELEIAKNN